MLSIKCWQNNVIKTKLKMSYMNPTLERNVMPGKPIWLPLKMEYSCVEYLEHYDTSNKKNAHVSSYKH